MDNQLPEQISSVNWSDIDNLTLQQRNDLLDFIHDREKQSKYCDDPRTFILYDSRLQEKLFNLIDSTTNVR